MDTGADFWLQLLLEAISKCCADGGGGGYSSARVEAKMELVS